MQEIQHNTHSKGGAFVYIIDGKALAEVVYTTPDNETMIIDHTEVDDSLKGQGIGKKLLNGLVEFVRSKNIKVIPVCSFAKVTFNRRSDWQDVLKNVK